MSQPSTDTDSRLLGTLQALVLFVGGVVGASVAVSAWAALAPSLGVAGGTTVFQLARTVFQFAGFVAPALLFVAAAGDRSLLPAAVLTRREFGLAVGGLIGLYLFQYGLLAALGAVGVAPVQNRAIDPKSHRPAYFLWMVLLSLAVVGPAEELLFRGAIQGLLKRAWGARVAIIGASALFGLLHYSVGSGSMTGALAYVVVAFLLGLVLGWLYERTGNLLVPALAHGGFNAVAFGLQYLSVT
jgi:membrane protease YdiL (CAAX protease family)